MSIEKVILCGEVGEGGLPEPKRRPIRLKIRGERRNVNVRIEDVRRSMFTNLSNAFLDLIDIAAYVYAADQSLSRSHGGRVDGPEIGEGWRRSLSFRIPVRERELWESEQVKRVLEETVGFLSDDYYSFDFETLKEDTRSLEGYLNFGERAHDGEVGEVVLFSGGLDSLAGAVHEIVGERRDVLLLNHRSTPKVVRRHTQLVKALDKHAGRHQPMHVPVRVNKAKKLGKEFTQRSRSFLYASLGAAVAAMFGLSRLRFYENGVVSLNLPISRQVIGGRATRTTHPRVLSGFARLFSLVAGKEFCVENPFLWKTKAEVVQLISRAGCSDLIGLSRSCAHTWMSTNQHRHCGTCSQCIDRRFAILAAGLEEHEDAGDYAVDLITGAREDDLSRSMLAAYVNSAAEIEHMSPERFYSEFGETSRILPYLTGGSAANAHNIHSLYQRHAASVTAAVDNAIGKHASDLRTFRVSSTSLLGLVWASSAPLSTSATINPTGGNDAEPLRNVFRRRNDYWAIGYQTTDPDLIKHSLGLEYLHILLSQPDRAIGVEELERRVGKSPQTPPVSSGSEQVDSLGLRRIHERLVTLREDEAECKKNRDVGGELRAVAEIDQLTAELRRSNGLNGRRRRLGDEREPIRKRVTNAIKRALEDISEFDPRLGAHLKAPVLRLGLTPVYSPQEPIEWDLNLAEKTLALREM